MKKRIIILISVLSMLILVVIYIKINANKDNIETAKICTNAFELSKQYTKMEFPDTLATYSTTYNISNYNRANNIVISANKINNIILMPGEEFSYNQILGERTEKAGYKPAPAYVEGNLVNEYGGGICQTSSTLYNAALLSNLEITSRTSHCYPAPYVPISRDATVSWGTIDFKFKNNRENPIKIKSTADNGMIKIEIIGIKQDYDYEVEIQSYIASIIELETQYKDDPNLEEGKEKVTQNGSNGCVGVAYKILKKNGNVVSKILLSQDTYSSKPKIINRGTKKV